MRALKSIFFAPSAAVLLAIALSGVLSARVEAADPALITTAPLTISPAQKTTRVLGEVRSLGMTTLVAPVTGQVAGPFLTSGMVAAGAVVARNTPADLTSSIKSAQAALAFAQAQYRRTRALVAKKVLAQTTLDQAQRDLATAQGALAALEVKANQQVLTAPFAGMLHYLVAPGAVVYKGAPIATISGRGTPWITALAPPATAARLFVGQKASLATSEWRGEGAIVAIGADARHDGLVQIRVNPPKHNRLLPGQWVWLTIRQPTAAAFSAPAKALVMRGAKTLVYVVRDGKAREVQVRVVAQRGGRAWITGKLRAGQRVALSGSTRLADGAAVAQAQ